MASQRAGRMVETESAPRLPRTQAREPAPAVLKLENHLESKGRTFMPQVVET